MADKRIAYLIDKRYLPKVKALSEADRGRASHRLAAVPLSEVRAAAPWSEAKLSQAIDALRSGRRLDPIRASRSDGAYVVEDGIHRVAAARILGHTHIPAHVEELARSEARVSKQQYITVEHRADGSKHVVDHPTKQAAHAYGGQVRREGRTVFAYSAADAAKHGLDPRAAQPAQRHTPARKSFSEAQGAQFKRSRTGPAIRYEAKVTEKAHRVPGLHGATRPPIRKVAAHVNSSNPKRVEVEHQAHRTKGGVRAVAQSAGRSVAFQTGKRGGKFIVTSTGYKHYVRG